MSTMPHHPHLQGAADPFGSASIFDTPLDLSAILGMDLGLSMGEEPALNGKAVVKAIPTMAYLAHR